MKIKITNTEDGLKLASCYVGSKLVGFDERILVGVDGRYQYPFYVTDLWQYKEITIDLSKNQPCIYACMKAGLEVNVEWVEDPFGHYQYDFLTINDCKEFFDDHLSNETIKSIEILGLEDMDGVTIEGGE